MAAKRKPGTNGPDDKGDNGYGHPYGSDDGVPYLESDDQNIANNSLYRGVGNFGRGLYDWASGQAGSILDPATPFNQEAAGLENGAADAKALSELQWQRQMEGLGRAMQYLDHSRGAVASVYGKKAGPALPMGLQQPAPAPTPGAPPVAPMPPAGAQVGAGLSDPGLAAYAKRMGMR